MTGEPVRAPAPAAEFRLNPDPSERTIETIEQRITDLQRLIELRFEAGHDAREAIKETFGVRIVSIEQALSVFQEGITRVPTDVDKQVSRLKELHGERFSAVMQQFVAVQQQLEERDKRAEQTSQAAKEAVNTAFLASKEAVAAALQAAKEQVAAQNEAFAQANNKAENTTSKLLEQLGVQINTTTSALNDKIDDLKGRLTTIEGRTVGSTTTQDNANKFAFAALAALGTLFGIGMAIYAALKH